MPSLICGFPSEATSNLFGIVGFYGIYFYLVFSFLIPMVYGYRERELVPGHFLSGAVCLDNECVATRDLRVGVLGVDLEPNPNPKVLYPFSTPPPNFRGNLPT